MSYIVFLSTKGLQMVQGNLSKIIFIFLLAKNLNLLKEQCLMGIFLMINLLEMFYLI